MSKFAVGDSVKSIKGDYEGLSGTIVRIWDYGYFPYELELDAAECNWCFAEDELEFDYPDLTDEEAQDVIEALAALIADDAPQRFEVGDEVRVAAAYSMLNDKVGEVVELDPEHPDKFCFVQLDGDKLCFAHGELEDVSSFDAGVSEAQERFNDWYDTWDGALRGVENYLVQSSNAKGVRADYVIIDGVHNFFDQKVVSRTSESADVVSHPDHYTSHPSGIECIEITKHMGFLDGNAMKYLWRYSLKSGVEDLKKCRQYLNWLIEREESL